MSDRITMASMSNAAAELTEKIRSFGVEVTWHNDVAGYRQALSLSDKKDTGEYFLEDLNALPPHRFFGLTGNSNDGRIIMSTACRYDSVEGWDLATYIQKFWSSRYYSEVKEEKAVMSNDAMYFIRGLTGPFGYVGDTWVDPSLSGHNLASYLVRLCVLYTNMEWRPAYIYGWMARKHAFKGLALRWGFPVSCPSGMLWDRPPRKQVYQDLCWVGCPIPAIETICRYPLDIGPTNIAYQKNSKP